MTALRMRARDFLSEDELIAVRERITWKGVAMIAHAWALIVAAVALVAWWPNPLTYLVAVGIIGSRQLGLAILMHDGAHGCLSADEKTNFFLSQWFCAYPVFSETRAYRRYHLQHHARTQQDDDPDLVLSAPFPITKLSYRRKLWRDISGQTGYQQRKAQLLNALGPSDWPLSRRLAQFREKLGPQCAVNAVMFAACAAAGVWWAYPLLWLVPLLTWMMVITRIRNIAEHAVVPDSKDPLRNTRTTMANALERLFVAPYRVNYHLEHHLFLFVPCWRLPEAHRRMLEKGLGSRMELRRGGMLPRQGRARLPALGGDHGARQSLAALRAAAALPGGHPRPVVLRRRPGAGQRHYFGAARGCAGAAERRPRAGGLPRGGARAGGQEGPAALADLPLPRAHADGRGGPGRP